MALVLSSCPEDLRKRLLDDLELVFPGILRHEDSAIKLLKSVFDCTHFAWYNRYKADVCFFFPSGFF